MLKIELTFFKRQDFAEDKEIEPTVEEIIEMKEKYDVFFEKDNRGDFIFFCDKENGETIYYAEVQTTLED